jgi:hypothetical protein
MTDAQARLWHVQRREELARMIDRAATIDALDKLHRVASGEFDDELRAQLARRVAAVKAGAA